MAQYEYDEMQDISWMYETSDDVLADCFDGNVDLDNVSYSHSFDSTELEESLIKEHNEAMERIRNLPKRDCVFISDDLPF